MRSVTVFAAIGSSLLSLAAGCSKDTLEIPTEEPESIDTPLVRVAWDVALHDGSSFESGISPTILSNGYLAYIHDGSSATRLFHVDPETGAVVDSFSVKHPTIDVAEFSVPNAQVVRDDRLVCRYGGKQLVILNLLTGEFEWTSNSTLSAREIQHYVYADEDNLPNGKVRLYQVDVSTGNLSLVVEVYDPFAENGSNANISSIELYKCASLPVMTSVIVSHYSNPELGWSPTSSYSAFDVSSGELIWRKPLPKLFNGGGSASYAGTELRVFDDTLRAFDPCSGEVLWTYAARGDNRDNRIDANSPGQFTFTPPIVDEAEGAVYLGSDNNVIYCLDAATGEERWRNALGGARFFLADIGDGMLGSLNKAGFIQLTDKRTGEPLAELPTLTQGAYPTAGALYDPEQRRVYCWDGARAYAYDLLFEPPGA